MRTAHKEKHFLGSTNQAMYESSSVQYFLMFILACVNIFSSPLPFKLF